MDRFLIDFEVRAKRFEDRFDVGVGERAFSPSKQSTELPSMGGTASRERGKQGALSFWTMPQ